MNIFENIYKINCEINLEGAVSLIFYLLGFTIFVIWLVDTSFGTKALVSSKQRRNNMPLFMPLFIIFVVFYFIFSFNQLASLLFKDFDDWRKVFATEAANIIASLVSILIILFVVKKYFVRGIKGFGLNIKTIPRDFIFAIICLFAILPVMTVILEAIQLINGLVYGPDYQIPTHTELQTLTDNSNIMVRIAIAFGTICVVPFLEEFLFRGLFQTMIRSTIYFNKHAAWMAIFLTSLFFAVTHANPSHWPVLFVLSVTIGYSYEKSGSLFRPVFIHMLFNASSVIFTWIQ